MDVPMEFAAAPICVYAMLDLWKIAATRAVKFVLDASDANMLEMRYKLWIINAGMQNKVFSQKNMNSFSEYSELHIFRLFSEGRKI
jgi:hypothetical protein